MTSPRCHCVSRGCSKYDGKLINITILQMNNNSVINFSSLYKNIINIITNNKYQITKIK